MIKPATRLQIDNFAADTGIFYVVMLLAGFWLLAGFLPPHRPAAGAVEIAGIFAASPNAIRAGMVLLMWAALICIPFSAIIARRIALIEGNGRVLTYSSIMGGAGLMVLTFYPPIWWLTAAFRPERAPELVQLLNDMSWLQFIGGASMFYALPIAIAVAALSDTNPDPCFPRWLGYYNLLTVMLILPDQLLFFFHTGPFAWNGLFGLWLPLALFGAWFIVHAVIIRQANQRDYAAAIIPGGAGEGAV